MEEGGGAKRSIREEEEGSSPQRNNGDMREEESEVTAVEGHSDILFDAATYAFEGHLMDRYRNLMAPIFEDVLRNVHARFLTDYKDASTAAKVIDQWEERAWSRRKDITDPKGGLPAVHYRQEPRRRVRGAQADMLWSFVENLVMAEMPAAVEKASGALSKVIARMEMALADAATNARDLRRAERRAANERLEAMRVSYESRLRELGARHHADVEAWKRRELNKVRDAAVAEVRRIQLDTDRTCGDAAMQARASAAQSSGLMVRVREAQADAADFAAALERTGAVSERRAAAGMRRMRAAKTSRAFNGWRLAVERSMLGVRVETLTRMLYDAQDEVKRVKQDCRDQDARWELRMEAVSKVTKCRGIALLVEKCQAAMRAWSRRARREAGRRVAGSCVLEERPSHPSGEALMARVRRQSARWRVGGLEYVEARWESSRVLDPRKRVVRNAARSGRRWLMFSRWRRVTFYRHLQTIAAAEVFGKVAMKIISKRWLAWATVEGSNRRAEEAARRAAEAKEAEATAKKAQALASLAGNHNRRSVFLSSFKRWRAHVDAAKQAVLERLKRVVARMRLFHASAAIHKWAEAIMVSRAELAAQRAELWAMRARRVLSAWRVLARRSADPLVRTVNGAWHQLLQTGAGKNLQPWLDPLDCTRLMMLVRAKGPVSVWRGRLWEQVVSGVDTRVRESFVKALETTVRRRPILPHFQAWREWTRGILSHTRSYQLWFRRTLPCRRALTAWSAALERRRKVEAAAARQFPRYRSRRVLHAWWLAAAESVSRGPPGGDTATAAAVRKERGPAESAAAWVAWESRGRPLQHWLGRALTIAANIPWHRGALANREGGPGAAVAQAIDARMSAATESLLDRTLRAGRGLNRDRDAHHGALGVHRHGAGGALGYFGTRPKLRVKMRDTEGDALRVLSDALEHASDVITAERAAADARVSAALTLADDSEDRERRRRQITLELFHQRGEMSRAAAAAAVAAVKAAGNGYDMERDLCTGTRSRQRMDAHDGQHGRAVQHTVRVSSAHLRRLASSSGTRNAASAGVSARGARLASTYGGGGGGGGFGTLGGSSGKNRKQNGDYVEEEEGASYDDGFHGSYGGGGGGGGSTNGNHVPAAAGRSVSAMMYGQEFPLPPPETTSRSWMDEDGVGPAAGATVHGLHAGGAQRRTVSTAPAGKKRLPIAGTAASASGTSRAAGGARSGTLFMGEFPSPSLRSSSAARHASSSSAAAAATLPAQHRPSTAGPRAAAVMASQHGGGGEGIEARNLPPPPGAVTGPLV